MSKQPLKPSRSSESPVAVEEPEPPATTRPSATLPVPPARAASNAPPAGTTDIKTQAPMPMALAGQTRAQFPPPGSIPATLPPLGRVPTAWTDLLVNFGPKATHFSGPIVSGSPTANHMIQHAWGAAVLTVPLRLDHSMGLVNVPMQFPHDAILLSLISIGIEDFDGAPIFELYTQPNGAGTELGQVTVPNAGAQNNNDIYAPLPGTGAVLPDKPFLAYAGANMTGMTTGSCIVLVMFARVTPAWF